MPTKLNFALLLTSTTLLLKQAVGLFEVETRELTFEQHNRLLQFDNDNEGNCDYSQCTTLDEIVSDCSGGLKRKEENFCGALGDTEFCCGDAFDCCALTGGVIAGISVGSIVVVALVLLCGCACCRCCPYHDKLCCAKGNNTVAAPATAVAPSPEKAVVAPATSVKNSGYYEA